ncbi:MAG TPA: rod shape-determining protein MreD [Negativicutes bacterium]|nr:rod shape-determining protein MreD [Negativicutes bacterium]
MKPFVWGLFLLATLVIQTTVLPLVAVGGARPDLLLLVVVSAGLLLGREHGVGMGFFAGLLQDLASGNIFGVSVLSKTATGYVAGLAERKVFKENVLLPLLAVIIATVFNSILMIVMLAFLGFAVDIPTAVANTFFVLGYNAVLAIPVHRVVCRIAKNELPDPNG